LTRAWWWALTCATERSTIDLDETLIGSHSEKDQVWLQIVALAHDLIVWTRRLLLTGELANAEPNVCSTDCSTRRRVHEAQNAPRTSLRPAAGQ
jgi:hypothetical protein